MLTPYYWILWSGRTDEKKSSTLKKKKSIFHYLFIYLFLQKHFMLHLEICSVSGVLWHHLWDFWLRVKRVPTLLVCTNGLHRGYWASHWCCSNSRWRTVWKCCWFNALPLEICNSYNQVKNMFGDFLGWVREIGDYSILNYFIFVNY